MSSNGSKNLLVVDDEPSVCALVCRVAEAAGYEVAAAVTHEEFTSAYDRLSPNVIAMDLLMPQVDGIALHGLDIRDILHKPFGESDLRRALSLG